MKTIIPIAIMITLLGFLTVSCKKDNSQDEINSSLSSTESLLLKDFQLVKSNDDSLILHVGPNGQFSDPNVMMEDSLYHMNDSLCNQLYLTYCKDMMDGDNMMGGNMMGGSMHGSGMMATHTYMGDTATVNQCYRNLTIIQKAHSGHHPKR